VALPGLFCAALYFGMSYPLARLGQGSKPARGSECPGNCGSGGVSAIRVDGAAQGAGPRQVLRGIDAK